MEFDNTQTIEFVDCGSYDVKLEPELHIKDEPFDYETLEDETIGEEEEPIETGLLVESRVKEEPEECNFNDNSTSHLMELDSFLERGWIEGTELEVEDIKLEPKIELDCDTQVSFLGGSALFDSGLPSGESSGTCLAAKPGPSIEKTQDGSGAVGRHKGTYACHSCPFETTQKRQLERHLPTHAGFGSDDPGKPFKCEVCTSRFAFQRGLTLHRKNVHAIRKPFKCTQCKYSATRGNHLRLHVMSKHLGEKPIMCAMCDYRCVQKGNMIDHIRNRHSGGEPFKCDRCRYQTSERDELVKHITRTHLSKVLNIT